MLVHEALARGLAALGVTHVFGVMGDANLFIIDSFTRTVGGTYVPAASEGSAVLAAMGYAQASGGLGVATVTHGPGLTNTITALVEGSRSRTPMLLLAGDTPADSVNHIQNIGQLELAGAAEVGFQQVRSAQSAAADLIEAARRAWAERLPVVVNIPIDLQWQDAGDDADLRAAADGEPVPATPELIEDGVAVIASANRPLVLAGRGASDARAKAALVELAHRIGAPLATTLRGKDLFAGEPSAIGIFGTLSDERALEVIGRADCVIAFGCGLNMWTSAEGALLKGKRVVHVNTDCGALNRYNAVTVAIPGDAASVAGAFVALLDEGEIEATRFSEGLVRPSEEPAGDLAGDTGTEDGLDLRVALDLVDRGFPSDRTLVIDNGRFIHHAFTRLHVPEPKAYVHAVNFGSLGLAMGTAFGASYANPDRPVLVACGDGGFAMGGLSDLTFMAQQHRNITVVIFNDSAYGAEYVQLANRGMDPSATTFVWRDFGPVAEALGAIGFTVRSAQELRDALERASSADGSKLIDIRIKTKYV
ncbi:thiamine pyrophosphate-binding protein [Dactylosporangium sp. NPDC000555]|uniref:thiamine pyrophosphate-binding protein n=1 Tax=Dactylosporangium sp. NPDC000555 TaxID=3154260 RepID=UPI003316E095